MKIVERAFNPDEIRSQLRGLNPQQRLAFGLGCSERLYPNYVAFASEERWGDSEALRAGLDMAWDTVLGNVPSSETVQRLKTRVERAEPNTEDFATILVSSALDAAATVGLSLRLVESGNVELAVDIASLCRDTVDMYIQATVHLDPSHPAFETNIVLHDLMQAELARQRSDLRALATNPWNFSQARRRRDEWRNPTVSNIGIGRPRNEP